MVNAPGSSLIGECSHSSFIAFEPEIPNCTIPPHVKTQPVALPAPANTISNAPEDCDKLPQEAFVYLLGRDDAKEGGVVVETGLHSGVEPVRTEGRPAARHGHGDLTRRARIHIREECCGEDTRCWWRAITTSNASNCPCITSNGRDSV